MSSFARSSTKRQPRLPTLGISSNVRRNLWRPSARNLGAKLVQARADKLETRLIAAMARQDAVYNRYAATVESVNKTTVVVSRSAAG